MPNVKAQCMGYKIIICCLFWTTLLSTEEVYLKTPDISQEAIIGTNVGIRPYRKSGVRLEAEWFNDKLIIHNYGYGGSGLTLCFGGSKEVLDLLETQKTHVKTIAVLGAGVVGLAAAYDLLEKGYEVHLYSDKWSPHLTSNVAAGSWTPHAVTPEMSNEKKTLQQRMLETAEQRFLRSAGLSPEFAGVKLICCYIFSDNVRKPISIGEEVLVHFDNGAIKQARKICRIGIDGGLFMEDLFAKVKSKGAIFQKHFQTLEDVLNLKEPVIVNCLSLGSREIFDDREFIPARGQIVYLKPQQHVDYMLFQKLPDSNYFFHIYPWSDRVILGGVYEPGEEEAIVNPDTIDRILQNAKKCLSSDL